MRNTHRKEIMDELETPEITTNKSYWKKSPGELNVGEALITIAMYPIAMVGGLVISGAAVVGVSKLADKFRKNKKSDSEETTEPTE